MAQKTWKGPISVSEGPSQVDSRRPPDYNKLLANGKYPCVLSSYQRDWKAYV